MVAVGDDEAGLVERLLEPADQLVALGVVGAEREQVVVVEVHAIGAELGEPVDGVDRVERGAGRPAEHVLGRPADGPDPERESVLRGRDVVHGHSSFQERVASRSATCWRRITGCSSAVKISWGASGHSGRDPVSAQAAWRAAPSATYSAGARHRDRHAEELGAIRRTASHAAAPPIRRTRSTGRLPAAVEAVGQAAQHAFDRGAGQVRRGGVAPGSDRAGRRWRQAGSGCARRPGRAAGSARRRPARRRSASAEAPGSTPSIVAAAVEHAGRVERADQRQEAAGRVGEPGDGTAGVGGGRLGDR